MRRLPGQYIPRGVNPGSTYPEVLTRAEVTHPEVSPGQRLPIQRCHPGSMYPAGVTQQCVPAGVTRQCVPRGAPPDLKNEPTRDARHLANSQGSGRETGTRRDREERGARTACGEVVPRVGYSLPAPLGTARQPG